MHATLRLRLRPGQQVSETYATHMESVSYMHKVVSSSVVRLQELVMLGAGRTSL